MFLVIFECYREIHSNSFKQKRGIWGKTTSIITLMSHRDSCVNIFTSHFPLLGVKLWRAQLGLGIQLFSVSYSWIHTTWCCILLYKTTRRYQENSLIFSLCSYYYVLTALIVKKLFYYILPLITAAALFATLTIKLLKWDFYTYCSTLRPTMCVSHPSNLAPLPKTPLKYLGP